MSGRIDSFLRLVVDQHASDLHFHAGNVPVIRHDGDLVNLPFRALSEEETRRFLLEIMTEEQRGMFEVDREIDFAYVLEGGARFRVFDVAMRKSAEALQNMEADLRNAVEGREFRLVFQPILELESGRVYGFEALSRWHRPRLGVILPPDFLPLAEQTGLILPIGAWVLREACQNARRWQDRNPAVRISVNLSGKQLAHPGLVDEVRTVLREMGLEASCLALEIAESVLMENVESAIAVLNQLRELGVELYMSHFGSGRLSLSSMPSFPLRGIKVDPIVVHRVGGRRADLDVVRSIMDLARSLGLRAIAEGVETVAQRERLIAFGCELGQGHLLGKPLEPKAAIALLKA